MISDFDTFSRVSNLLIINPGTNLFVVLLDWINSHEQKWLKMGRSRPFCFFISILYFFGDDSILILNGGTGVISLEKNFC